MDEMMTKFIDGHKLAVYRLISPGLGIWFNGYIDGKQSVSTGGLKLVCPMDSPLIKYDAQEAAAIKQRWKDGCQLTASMS